MQTAAWLRSNTRLLEKAEIETARLDCLVLLEDATGKDRAWLLSHPEYELQGSVLEILNTKIVQRTQHVPIAYIRGHAEFYGREFLVNEHTLVPRPETEAMISLVCEFVSDEFASKNPMLIDVGTGTGAIAITAKLEIPTATVMAIDIDDNCLKTAKHNAVILGAHIEFLQGNLLEPLDAPSSPTQPLTNSSIILLCNLPYVPDGYEINLAAGHEPRLALFGGSDGLDLYRELFKQMGHNIWKPRYILAESLPAQHSALASLALDAGYNLETTNDFIQLFGPTADR